MHSDNFLYQAGDSINEKFPLYQIFYKFTEFLNENREIQSFSVSASL